jgi:hypothetical protein
VKLLSAVAGQARRGGSLRNTDRSSPLFRGTPPGETDFLRVTTLSYPGDAAAGNARVAVFDRLEKILEPRRVSG